MEYKVRVEQEALSCFATGIWKWARHTRNKWQDYLEQATAAKDEKCQPLSNRQPKRLCGAEPPMPSMIKKKKRCEHLSNPGSAPIRLNYRRLQCNRDCSAVHRGYSS